jgi:hypothetical protein
MQQISPHSVVQNGVMYEYGIGCAMADVWCASIPFLWNSSRTIRSNVRHLLLFTVCLFGLNMLRLTISDILLVHGVRWELGHDGVNGITLFIVWLGVVRVRGW